MDEVILTRIRQEAYDKGYQDGKIDGYNLAGTQMSLAKQERKKGKWTYIDEAMFGNPYGSYKCSVCDNRMPYKTNFCQRCGADMRETGGDANEISRFK